MDERNPRSWSAQEIEREAGKVGISDPDARIVGIYFEMGADGFRVPFGGVGGEGVVFVGVDRTTGRRIVAQYMGATISLGANVIPGLTQSIGGFAFGDYPLEASRGTPYI